MKKNLLALLLSFIAVGAFAQEDKVVTATYGNATGNTTRTMTVALDHATDYVAFFLNLTLPEGTTVTGVSVKSPLKNGGTVDLSAAGGSATESTDFNVPFNQEGTKCNIVGYNLGNKVIGGTSGDILLTLTLETASGVAYDAAGVTAACTFVDASSNEVALNTPVTEARLWGDVDNNKQVNGIDVARVANVVLEKSTLNVAETFAADIDGNSKINGIDIARIANMILEK